MSNDSVVADIGSGVLRLTINRAEARNALNDDVMRSLTEAIAKVETNASIRAIVITGAGDRAFCAGGDLKTGARTFEFDPAALRTPYAEMLRVGIGCSVPLIARVNGYCYAGGMGLLAMCDMAVASSTAQFALPEVKVGLFPMQVAALLRHIIPARVFAEMCLTGEPISAEDALAVRLVNYVAEPQDLDAKVDWLIARLSGKSPTAIRRGKYALRAIRDMTIEQSLFFMESQLGTLAQTEDAQEGLRAFNERRAPVWPGR